LFGHFYKIENNKDKNIFDSINAGLGFLFAEVTGSVKDLLGREDEQYFFLQISLLKKIKRFFLDQLLIKILHNFQVLETDGFHKF
jgi:Na+-translocating ferredoxin:NAD+ oxidoreductase RnfE subunit